MGKRRRTHTAAYKAEVVNLILEQKRPIKAICRELDLAESMVRRWVDQARVDRAEGALSGEEREELQRLRRENEQLRMERDILKKATAFFAKDTQ